MKVLTHGYNEKEGLYLICKSKKNINYGEFYKFIANNIETFVKVIEVKYCVSNDTRLIKVKLLNKKHRLLDTNVLKDLTFTKILDDKKIMRLEEGGYC